MPEVRKTVIVPYTPQQMFALVDGVERYPEFLPWCTGVEVLGRDEEVTRAALSVGLRGIKQRFATENHNQPPHEIRMLLVEGPFRAMNGYWRFNDLAGKGSKIEFSLSYEFSSRMLATLVGPLFSHISGTMVEAFVKRAERLYG